MSSTSKARNLGKQEERVETGIVQFGEDWPGIFLRGDNAIALAYYINRYLHDRDDSVARMNLESYAALFRRCNGRVAKLFDQIQPPSPEPPSPPPTPKDE